MDKVRQKMLEQKKKAMIKALKEKQGKSSASNKSGTSKTVITANETVTFNAQLDEVKKKIKEEVSAINNNANMEVERLLAYIESQGTEVHRLENASALLEKINEHTGFITPLKGTKAIYINTITKKSLNASSEPMFIVSADKETDYYMLLREFYLWYSFTHDLSGFDFETQEVFKKYMNEKRNPSMSKLTINEMALLKDALARDSEANEFVMEIIQKTEGGANVLKKMQEGGADI